MVQWPPKDPGENKLLRFEFGNHLEVGETIQSAVLTVDDQNDLDATPNIFPGVHTIVSPDVVQPCSGGMNGAAYYIKCYATTSSGRVHLIDAVLPVLTFTGT